MPARLNDGDREPARVFLSYSRRDAAVARRVLTALEGRHVDAWVDWEDIPPSADWWREVCAAIEATDAFVFLMSPDSVASRVCTDEVLHAVRHGKRVIPVVCHDIGQLPSALEAVRRINWIFLRPTDSFETGVSQVMTAVDTDLDWVRAHTRLLTRAVEWEARGRDASFLLRTNDLTEAERWLARGPEKDPRPTALQTEYILAGRAAATRQQRRLTAYAVGAGMLIAAAAVAALVGFTRAERNAREALSRQLAAESRADIGVDVRGALARAAQAFRTSPTREARSAVLAASYRAAGATRLLAGHEGRVTQTAFSPDGRSLATAGNDGTVMLWDVASGRPVRQLAGHRSAISRTVFSPSGRQLVTASGDRTAIIWAVDTGTVLHRLEGHSSVVVNIAISPDGSTLATADEGSVHLWDMATGKRLRQLLESNVWSVTFSPDSRRIATGNVSALVILWDVATGAPVHRFAGHRDGFLPLASAAFVPTGDQLVTTAAADPHALVWDLASGRQVMRLGPHKGAIDNVAVSPDGRWVATASTEESAVYIWDARSGTRARVLAGSRTTDLIYSVLAFGAGGRQLVTRTSADTIVLWDVESGTELRRFRGHGRETLTAAVTADGRWLATGGPDAISVLWDLADPGPARRLQRLPQDLPRGVFSPDGGWVAVRDGDRAIVLDVATGNPVREFLHGARVGVVAFSADGKRLTTGGADRTALVWDIGSGAIVRRFPGHDDFVSHAEFAADGSTLTIATGPFARERVVWDLLTDTTPVAPIRREQNAATAGGAHVFDIAYSADGRRYATTTLDDVNDDPVVWDRRTGTELHRLRGHHAEVQTVAFSADGRWVITGDREGVAIVWDASTGALLRRLVGHTDTIEQIAISPDATLIATASDDETVVLWDAETGTPLQTFAEHTRSVAYVSFSPDGKRLLTSAHDGVLMLLDIDVPSLAAQACRALDPGVSAETWARIVGRRYPASCR